MSARRPQFLFPDGATFGASNLILQARARRHRATDYAGPLSIKTVVEGRVEWEVGDRRLTVAPGSFLVLGASERYSMEIDEPRPVETACAFFRAGFVEEVARDATSSVDAALDHPERSAPAIPWISRMHQDSDTGIARRVQTMARRCRGQIAPSVVEEDFLLLAQELLLLYWETAGRIARLPAVRASTRWELVRRVERGREYLHGHAEGAVSLDEVARAACVSRYHFHRAFTQLTGRTPHAYLTELRLGQARAMLRSGMRVSEACGKAGFTSVPSFCTLFRKRYGLPPGTVVAKGKEDNGNATGPKFC